MKCDSLLDQAINDMFRIMGVNRDDVELVVKPIQACAGYWVAPGDGSLTSSGEWLGSHSLEKATIAISSRQIKLDNFFMTLAHELQHHRQWTEGRFVESYDIHTRQNYLTWEGTTWNMGPTVMYLEYMAQPWEIEAYARQKTALAEFKMTYSYQLLNLRSELIPQENWEAA